MCTYGIFRVRQKTYWGSVLDEFTFLSLFFFNFVLKSQFSFGVIAVIVLTVWKICCSVTTHSWKQQTTKIKLLPLPGLKKKKSFLQIDIVMVFILIELFWYFSTVFEITAIVMRFSDTWLTTWKWLQFQTTVKYARAKYLLLLSISWRDFWCYLWG